MNAAKLIAMMSGGVHPSTFISAAASAAGVAWPPAGAVVGDLVAISLYQPVTVTTPVITGGDGGWSWLSVVNSGALWVGWKVVTANDLAASLTSNQSGIVQITTAWRGGSTLNRRTTKIGLGGGGVLTATGFAKFSARGLLFFGGTGSSGDTCTVPIGYASRAAAGFGSSGFVADLLDVSAYVDGTGISATFNLPATNPAFAIYEIT